MKYFSTRGSSFNLTFEEALFQGLAPDGGLYIPDYIPHFTPLQLQEWKTLAFDQLCFHLMRPFIAEEEIPNQDLQKIMTDSFATFTHPQVTPLVQLEKGVHVLELFHGPTFAFKDVALQVVGNLFAYFLKKKKIDLTVVGATSGDTGGAAIYGLRGKPNVQVFILHPKGRVSSVQEAQMTSVLDPNVHNIALEGSFDDCQDIVKRLFSDTTLKHHFGAVNSINWARIMVQTSYYFHSWFQLSQSFESLKVRYVVPTGNFGDVLAGFYALKMGLPIEKLVVATNDNDILHRFFVTGRYEKLKEASQFKPVAQTLSPAMDILVSSNFERLMWYLSLPSVHETSDYPNTWSTADRDVACQKMQHYMRQLKEEGGFSVDATVQQAAKRVFNSFSVTNSQTTDCIQRHYHARFATEQKPGYILDPHTAVGVVAAEYLPFSGQTVCLSTASPGKFPEAVLDAINNIDKGLWLQSSQHGFKPLTFEDFAPAALVGLKDLPKRCVSIETRGDMDKAYQEILSLIDGVKSRL